MDLCFIRPIIAIYGPVIYTALYVLLLIRATVLRGQAGGGWALEIETFLGPVKWHRASRRGWLAGQSELIHCGGGGREGDGEGEDPWKGWALNITWNSQHEVQNTPGAKLVYLKLPIYLFFIWRLDLMIFIGENPLLDPLEGVGPENLDFLDLSGTCFAHGHFRAQKCLNFHGPPLPLALEIKNSAEPFSRGRCQPKRLLYGPCTDALYVGLLLC